MAPALSPDLNPIEYLWHELKDFVRAKRCETKEELAAAIEEFRQTVTPQKCSNYIRKVQNVCISKLLLRIFNFKIIFDFLNQN